MAKISILTPVYKPNPSHLKQAIESILNQTFKDFEFILLNDCPEDKTSKKIITSYKDPRIKYYQNSQNLGISESRNKLIKLSTTNYLAIFDHDDIALPNRLYEQYNFLRTHKDYGVVGSNFIYLNKHTNKLKTLPQNNTEIKQSLLKQMPMLHPSLMLKKSILIKHNIKYDKSYFPTEDYALLKDLMDKTKFYNLKTPLVYYRNHSSNTSSKYHHLMLLKDTQIKKELQQKNPKLYQKISSSKIITTRFKLFNTILLLTIKDLKILKEYYLFGKIKLLSIRTKTTYL